MELVPLKIKIGTKENGHAKYPDFNSLDVVVASGMDWSKYIDVEGDGWKYDKKYGHKEESVDSPRGMQWGVVLIDDTFAGQAVAAFPDECEIVDETDFETFYEDRVTAHLPDEDIDLDTLNAIKAKQDLGLELTQEQIDALDPTKDVKGIKKNKNKKWVDYKADKGFTIKEAVLGVKAKKKKGKKK